MAYLAPIHRPTSVRHALKLNLLHPEEECLVLAKVNRVEIWVTTPENDALIQIHTKSIYGRVSMLAKIRPPGSNVDHLFIGTARFQYFTVVWNAATRSLETVQTFYDATEKHMQGSQSRDRCVVDPTGQLLVMELFQGVLNLVKIRKPRKGVGNGYLDTPEQVRITELKVRASAFLYTETKCPKLAILYDAGKSYPDIRLATYRVIDDKGQYSDFSRSKDRENDLGNLDNGASILISVPKGNGDQKRYIVRNATGAKAQLGGILILGETKITYLDDESKVIVESVLDEPNVWIAWERYDDLNYLLADEYSRLSLLTLDMDGAVVTGMTVRQIGVTTKATVMVHMGYGLLYIASHEGDSQLVQLSFTSEQPTIELVQIMHNIAPILDFTVMDLGGRDGEGTNEYSSGQARLVTGSGVWEGGSLRSVRSGVGLEDLGELADIKDIRSLFSLRSAATVTHSDMIAVSLDTETRLFKFDQQGDIEELGNFRGLSLDASTLLVRNLPDDRIIQVTSSAVLLIEGNALIATWKPPAGHIITAASCNDKYLLLSSNGVTLVTLDIEKRIKVCTFQTLENEEQVACIYVPSQFSNIGVVGFWNSGSISLLSLEDLRILCSEELRSTNDASIPRNIALTQVLPVDVAGPTLFVAMEDGIVLTFNVDRNDYSLSGRKSIVLGTQQALFEVLPGVNGLFNVFATCEHPSLIYGNEGRIVCSGVTAETATHVCSFDSEAYPDSILVATAENFKISRIDTKRTTHVNPLPMGETVRRIAYSARERAFGLGCMDRSIVNGAEYLKSTFRLVEEVNFGEVGKPFVFEPDNLGEESIECVIRAPLPWNDELVERFIVGTSWESTQSHPHPSETKGRIHVFGIDNGKSPYLIHSGDLKGACRCLAIMMVDGSPKIVAGLTKTVVVYDYQQSGPQTAELSKLATYRTSTSPISLHVNDNTIAVGDLMKSVSLIEYTHPKSSTSEVIDDNKPAPLAHEVMALSLGINSKLTEVGRHMQSLWTTAVVHIEEDSYLVADHDGNLVVLRRNRAGVTMEDQKRLEVTSELNLGEVANKIVSVDVHASASAMVVPRAFIGTSDGSIYLFSTISPSSQDLLMRLQERMSGFTRTLGDLDFNTYRRFKTDKEEHEEPFRFVDGELLEHFLDVPEEVQAEICQGLGPSVEDVRNLVEELKRLH